MSNEPDYKANDRFLFEPLPDDEFMRRFKPDAVINALAVYDTMAFNVQTGSHDQKKFGYLLRCNPEVDKIGGWYFVLDPKIAEAGTWMGAAMLEGISRELRYLNDRDVKDV